MQIPVPQCISSMTRIPVFPYAGGTAAGPDFVATAYPPVGAGGRYAASHLPNTRPRSGGRAKRGHVMRPKLMTVMALMAATFCRQADAVRRDGRTKSWKTDARQRDARYVKSL